MIAAWHDPTADSTPGPYRGKIAPLTVTRAKGSYFWDSGGNRWLDMCGQLAYVNIGHAHPHVVDAIKRQAETMPVIAPDHTSPPASRLAEMLAEVTPAASHRPSSPTAGPRPTSTRSGWRAPSPAARRS